MNRIFFTVCIIISVLSNVFAQTNEEKLKNLQLQLDNLQIQNGNEDDVDARKINENIEELESILKKRDSLNFQISILKTELLLAQARLKTCENSDKNDADYNKIAPENTIYFDFNSSSINTTQIEKINNLVQSFSKSNSNKKILVIGHSDAKGSDAYNLALSKKRSIAVQKYLVSKGVKSSKILIDYRGESDLLYDNNETNKENIKLNRRVILLII